MIKKNIIGVFATLCLGVACNASAASYPDKPVKIVVPFGAGSSTDILTRAVADGLSKKLNNTFIVDNKTGAGGAIGTSSVASSKPDGYTLLMASNGPMAANSSLYSQLNYDPAQDFEPIILMGKLPMILVAHPDAESDTIEAIISQAKTKPDSMNFGASNTTARVWVELMKKTADIQPETVLYSNVGALLTDLMGGQIPYAFENVGPSRPLVESGKLKAVAVTSAERAKFAPDVPTMAESGFPQELVVWFALFAPKGTPEAVVNELNQAVNELLETPELLGIAEQIDMQVAGGSPSDLRDYQAKEIDNWRNLVELTGVRIN